jgi:hypothetical protein
MFFLSSSLKACINTTITEKNAASIFSYRNPLFHLIVPLSRFLISTITGNIALNRGIAPHERLPCMFPGNPHRLPAIPHIFTA